MYTFSKEVAAGKTAKEIVEDAKAEEERIKQREIQKEKDRQEKLAYLN